MSKIVNACCSGDMMVMTANGAKSFEELAKEGKDVSVYCLNEFGEYTISMMIHPRITGYNVDVYKVRLENGLEFNVTPEHRVMTNFGYTETYDIIVGDDSVVLFDLKEDDQLLYDDCVSNYTETYTNLTKKGALMKTCEFCGNQFEVIWDEREICSCNEHHTHMLNIVNELHKNIEKNYKNACGLSKVVSIDYIGRMDVYNGTVERYHNYFTVDDKTNLMINQLNCGEIYNK